MSDECIHGLDGGLCALCFPPATPVAAPAPIKKRAARPPLSSLVTPRGAPPKAAARATATAKSSAAAKRPSDNVGAQRIYHVTHLSNLPAILASGSILADANDTWDKRPTVDISAPATRELRAGTLVDGPGSLPVAHYVPFFLSPNAAAWAGIRSSETDARLDLDAHGSTPFDFVILVSTVKQVTDWQLLNADDRPVAVADGDAAGARTRFGVTPESAERMLRTLRADPEDESLLAAEFLVGNAFPLELLSLIGVAHDKVRDAVKEVLAAGTLRPKVAVYPPWFQPADA